MNYLPFLGVILLNVVMVTLQQSWTPSTIINNGFEIDTTKEIHLGYFNDPDEIVLYKAKDDSIEEQNKEKESNEFIETFRNLHQKLLNNTHVSLVLTFMNDMSPTYTGSLQEFTEEYYNLLVDSHKYYGYEDYMIMITFNLNQQSYYGFSKSKINTVISNLTINSFFSSSMGTRNEYREAILQFIDHVNSLSYENMYYDALGIYQYIMSNQQNKEHYIQHNWIYFDELTRTPSLNKDIENKITTIQTKHNYTLSIIIVPGITNNYLNNIDLFCDELFSSFKEITNDNSLSLIFVIDRISNKYCFNNGTNVNYSKEQYNGFVKDSIEDFSNKEFQSGIIKMLDSIINYSASSQGILNEILPVIIVLVVLIILLLMARYCKRSKSKYKSTSMEERFSIKTSQNQKNSTDYGVSMVYSL